jgi:hypothetical protein
MPAAPASITIGVCGEHPALDPRTSRARNDSRLHDQREDRPDPEHHRRMAEHSVETLPAFRARLIFGDGQGGEVPDAAAAEIAGRGVMHGMGVAPARERLEHEQSHRRPEPRIRTLGAQERPVCAVVKDDVAPYEEPGGGDRQQQRHRI